MITAMKDQPAAASLDDKLAGLPRSCGCYLLEDAQGEVVYIGKAKSLRARVRSYFAPSSSDDRAFLPLLRRVVADVETVVTESEKEAAVLENDLIKRYQPRFNVKLRDDKDFLCLRLDPRQPWPRLETVRRPSADGARYFGPYHSASAARRTLRVVNKHFQLRTCSDGELRRRTRPCLQYQIRRCPAPCVHDVDRARYGEQVRAVGLFLDGRHDELTRELEARMQEASARLDYELAAIYRDQLRAVESIRQSQRVVSVRAVDQDVIGMHREEELTEMVVMLVRQGHVTDRRALSLGRSALPDEELLGGFLTRYYGELVRPEALPDEILVPVRPEASQGIAAWATERRGRKVALSVPRVGAKAKLLALATENAAHAFREKRRLQSDLETRLERLQHKLRLPSLPHVIECCDISHHGGGNAYGSIVAMRDAELDKSRYRSFRVQTTTTGDDYAALYEVLARRFRRGREAAGVSDAGSDEGGWELPDLMVVDGGRGQLAVASAAARDLGLHELSLVGLAKERVTVTGEELVDRIYLPGQKNGIPITPRQPGLVLLAQLRDEAHRFANRGRLRAGARRELRSALRDVAGIGPVTEKALLGALGSVEAVRRASDEQILAVPGVTRRQLVALRDALGPPQ